MKQSTKGTEMNSGSNLCISMIIVVCLAILTSCNRTTEFIEPLPGPIGRSVLLQSMIIENGIVTTFADHPSEILGQFEIGIRMGVTGDRPPGGGEKVARYEVDFGDGSGWEDITAEARNWDFSQLSAGIDPDRLTTHVYDVPGDYLLQGRVTYWDGEILTTAGGEGFGGSNLQVTILP